MSHSSILRPLEEVLAWLPFEVDDFAAVNALFARWHQSRDEADLDLLIKWMYAYTYRYVMVRFVRNDTLSVVDVDILLSEMLLLVHDSMDQVTDPDKFASYASVICRNVYTNHLRKLMTQDRLERKLGAEAQVERGQFREIANRDNLILRRELDHAIKRLPEALQQTIRQRFLEELPYKAIASETGYTTATLRTFVHKALKRLHRDPQLANVMREWSGA